MGWFTKKKSTDNASNVTALALQDPRTRVKTTSAATETTNTAVQNSTIFDSNNKTVTFMATRQTVTHTQKASVTEMITRRTPSQAELDELLAQLRMSGGSCSTTTTTTSSSKRATPSSLNGVALRSTPSFKAEPKRSSTLVKLEQTSMSQKQGRNFTQHVETTRVKLEPAAKSKTTWPPQSSTYTTTIVSPTALSKPYTSPFKPFDSGYVSPYAAKTSTTTSTIFARPTVTTASFGTKPVLSTPKITSPKPFISLNSSTGAVPKRNPGSVSSISSISSRDAQCTAKPSLQTVVPKANAKKLKPADVIIFNQEKFDTDNEFRDGTAEDAKKLEKTFKRFKCKVDIKTNPTLADIRSTVRKLETKNFENHSALVLVVLSHGQRNDTVAAKDGEYKLDDDIIFPIVKNRTLQNKPKILFVQACKGAREPGRFKTDAVQPHGIPSEILKCYSTYEGYVSYRHDDGTPFIQTLCDTLQSKPNVDIETIMTEVRRLVKVYTKDSQIPSVTSTLTTKYVFGDYA